MSNAQIIDPVSVSPLAVRFRRDDDRERDRREGAGVGVSFLTQASVRRIRQALRAGVRQAEIARRERVHPSIVSRISLGQAWDDIDPTDQPIEYRGMTTADVPYLTAMAQTGDQEALAELLARHEHALYVHCERLLYCPDTAADVCQETLLKAATRITSCSPDLHFNAWIYRIATNACLDVIRRRQRLRWVPWNGPAHDHRVLSSPFEDPERMAVSQETRSIVQRVLARMTHRHRRALILREYEGLSCEEIGEVMGLSRTAIKSLLFRARGEFRAVYAAVTGEIIPPPQARATITRRRSGLWRPDEDDLLRAGFAAGDSWTIIGSRVHRAGGCCYHRAVRLGLVVPVSKEMG